LTSGIKGQLRDIADGDLAIRVRAPIIEYRRYEDPNLLMSRIIVTECHIDAVWLLRKTSELEEYNR
jgi:hypothetical protein